MKQINNTNETFQTKQIALFGTIEDVITTLAKTNESYKLQLQDKNQNNRKRCRNEFEMLKTEMIALEQENEELRMKILQRNPNLLRKLPKAIMQLVISFLDKRPFDFFRIVLPCYYSFPVIYHKEDNTVSIYDHEMPYPTQFDKYVPLISHWPKRVLYDALVKTGYTNVYWISDGCKGHELSWNDFEQLGTKRFVPTRRLREDTEKEKTYRKEKTVFLELLRDFLHRSQAY